VFATDLNKPAKTPNPNNILAAFRKEQKELLEYLGTSGSMALIAHLQREKATRSAMDMSWIKRKQHILQQYPLNSRPCPGVYRLPLPHNAAADKDMPQSLHSAFIDLTMLARKHLATTNTDDKSMSAARDRLLLCPYIKQIASNIFTFPVFTEEFSRQVMAEVDHLKDHLPESLKSRPNSMNNHGVLLDEVGFTEGFSDVLLDQYIRPMSALLYPENGGGTLDHHRCFTVQYAQDKDISLATHFDNAEVTLNINLSLTDMQGQQNGDLFFHGKQGEPRPQPVRFQHRIGWGVLHLGKELHCATPLIAGERTNLIMWFRSAAWRLKNGCAMCGETAGLKFAHIQNSM